MGFSASAEPHTFIYSLVRSSLRSFIPLFVCSYIPPFLHVRTHHCWFISPAVCSHPYTPCPRLHALPVICLHGLFIHTEALSNTQTNLRGSYALPGPPYKRTNPQARCSPTVFRHVKMHATNSRSHERHAGMHVMGVVGCRGQCRVGT